MKSLLDRIAAAAAEKLTVEPGTPPERFTPLFKKWVATQTKWLRSQHTRGLGGLDVCHARAAIIDEAVRHLLDAVWPPDAPRLGTIPFTLVATGGYGRSEMNPHSDVDLLFVEGGGIIRDDLSTPLSKVPPALIQALYDIGLDPGERSVRTVAQCVELANSSMESKTSLLDARFLAGDRALFKRLQETILQRCIHGKEAAYLEARLIDQAKRRAKHGNSACMQEPNVKNGAGGLRDYQNLLWMAFVKYGIGDPAELHRREILTDRELHDLTVAYDFLLRVRTELHYQAGRAADTLTPILQPQVARALQYSGDPRRRTARFMHDYYTHARNIYLITRTLEEILALKEPAGGRRTWRDLLTLRRKSEAKAEEIDGLTIIDNQIRLRDRRTVRDTPVHLFRAFLYAQKRGLRFHPDFVRQVRDQVPRIDNRFRSDPRIRDTFLEILNIRGNVAPTLRAMHEVGLLGKYLPEFGGLTNLVGHEHYHRYAVDEHTLTCIEKLDRVTQSDVEPFVRYADVFRNIESPWILYLALLLHDTGKAIDSGNHATVGGEYALRVAKRLGLDGASTHQIRLVIELHLAMVKTGQQKDLEDPAVISSFAAQIQSVENLELLHIHTFADSMGTSETLWTGFKDALHWELFLRTRDFLRGDHTQEEVAARRRQLLREDVQKLLPRTFSSDEIDAHFDGMPERYFRIQPPEKIARDLVLAHQFMHHQLTEEERALEPAIHWQENTDRGYTILHICTWDRAGLFSKITGAFAACGINIHGAQIFTRLDSVSLDEFYVTDGRTGRFVTHESRQKFESTLYKTLTSAIDLKPLIAKTRLFRPLWVGVEGDQIPTIVHVDNDATDDRTLIQIQAEDRVGLLYAISQVLVELKLDLIVAKISTEAGAALDNFFVTEIGGGKVTDPERVRNIERRLREAIGSHS